MASPRARASVSPSVNVPSAPARDLGAYACFASRVRARLDQFSLYQGSARAPACDWIILFDYITNLLRLSILQKLNLGGILCTTCGVL
jgi:hypothetical protein